MILIQQTINIGGIYFMNNSIKGQFDKLFDRYDKRFSAMQKNKQQEKDEEQDFFEYFENKITTVIYPCMEQIGKMLQERSHQYKIKQYHTIDNEEASITLIICPKGNRLEERFSIQLEVFPYISFSTRMYEKKVIINLQTFEGSGRYNAECDITELTEQVVTTHILDGLKEILK